MSRNKHAKGGRNFDGLTPRFKRNIYDTLKGQLRLSVLRKDFHACLPNLEGLSVLDIGVGQGQFAQWLHKQGVGRMFLVDISQDMLTQCQQGFDTFVEAQDENKIHFLQCSVQDLREKHQGKYDLIVCHALIEWLENPECLFDYIVPFVKKGTVLSLIFYNVDGLIYKNLLRRNFHKVKMKDYRGHRGSLTPIKPLKPESVKAWTKAAGYELLCHSGIRVFHDYILDPEERKQDPEGITEMELKFSQVLPYRDLGRYVHMLCKKIN